jgi:hypothetical protein
MTLLLLAFSQQATVFILRRLYIQIDKNGKKNQFKWLIPARTPPVKGPPWEQEDSQRLNYIVLPLCPMAAFAVTTVTLPVLAWRRLAISSFLHGFYFGEIFTSTDNKYSVFGVMPEHDLKESFLDFSSLSQPDERNPVSCRVLICRLISRNY